MLPQLNSITPVNMFKNGGQELHVFVVLFLFKNVQRWFYITFSWIIRYSYKLQGYNIFIY